MVVHLPWYIRNLRWCHRPWPGTALKAVVRQNLMQSVYLEPIPWLRGPWFQLADSLGWISRDRLSEAMAMHLGADCLPWSCRVDQVDNSLQVGGMMVDPGYAYDGIHRPSLLTIVGDMLLSMGRVDADHVLTRPNWLGVPGLHWSRPSHCWAESGTLNHEFWSIVSIEELVVMATALPLHDDRRSGGLKALDFVHMTCLYFLLGGLFISMLPYFSRIYFWEQCPDVIVHKIRSPRYSDCRHRRVGWFRQAVDIRSSIMTFSLRWSIP